ncbi:four-carbon acid sugar kinase family protein [Agrobacterium rosae]|uniref:Four-carbon acid sugar kinase family protein n=1 Tax=Agrobacterium rosae TaxID=1972867 RepID=A0AAW9FHJ3_9HYPH|nr:four-carbon acid sugar kinase family protein [Agrobacterium rosae]MDX8304017.1 four-carbon acid sugar kinase family protein [Agrobacterium rosae]MDX8314135.1 four-carbon acid sugar kinase family protein [Agrobacterium rosae]
MNRHFDRLLIVADDLTGALDTAAPFAAAGMKVTVVANQAFVAGAIAGDADVITVTTRSREIPADEAANRVASIKAAMKPGIRLFKKVDSRMKGNLAAELAALAFERAIVLPGIPEFGRIVSNGMIDGFGVDTPISIAQRLGALAKRCRFPDTLTPDDMRDAAATIEDNELMVGALSLAKAIAGESQPSPLTYPSKRMVMAIGSRDPITLAQVAGLKAAHPDLLHISAPNGVVAAAEERGAHTITLIQATPSETEASPLQVAGALAASVAKFSQPGDTILLSGGATAEAYFDQRGIHMLGLAGEALPGLPVAEFDGTFYITKSGGFGTEDTLLRLAVTVTGGEAETWGR